MSKNYIAYTFLTFAALFWSGNFIIGKFATLFEVPPLTLNFLRWVMLWFILIPLTIKEILAKKNYINCSKQSNLRFYCGHWWTPFESLNRKLDLAISNPPYIPMDTYEKLSKEVKDFEPEIALLGGEDGLEHIREIIQQAPLFLKEQGWLILENHFDQGEKVKQILIKNKFTSVEIVNDLNGIGRFTVGRYK